MTVEVTFGRNIANRDIHTAPQIVDGVWSLTVSESIAVGNATSIEAPDAEGPEHLVARVFNNESAIIYVSFGSAPNAATDDVFFAIPSGTVEYFGVQSGNKCSAVSARS
jgi:ABC-type phosphate transport system substrate-binding protein